VPIDYVVVVSDPGAGETTAPGIGKVMEELNSGMRLFAQSPGGFVRVYQRLR